MYLDEECYYKTSRLPWINNNIRKLMRKRNRLYKKNKTKTLFDNFKQLRNEITSNLRKAKQEYVKSLANKLKTPNWSSQDYWKTLKPFIKGLYSCIFNIIGLGTKH